MLPHKEKAVSTNLHEGRSSRRAASAYKSAVKPADFADNSFELNNEEFPTDLEASDVPFSVQLEVQATPVRHVRSKGMPTQLSPSKLPHYVRNSQKQVPVDTRFAMQRVRPSMTAPDPNQDYNNRLPSGMSNMSDSDPEFDFAKEKVDAVMTGVASKLEALKALEITQQSQDTVVEYFHTGKTTRRGREFGGATDQFTKEVKKEATVMVEDVNETPRHSLSGKMRVKRKATFKVQK